MVRTMNENIYRAVIAILALADGTIHLSLDWILFRGNLFGTPGAPGRPAPRTPLFLPTNELFVLNFLGAIVLVALFLLAQRYLGAQRWIMNIVLILYEASTFTAWMIYGRPNPMGLGFLSKGIEIINILILLAFTAVLLRARSRATAQSPLRAS